MTLKIALITLGCAKNEVDSANMTARLQAAGYDVVEHGEIPEELAQLDALLINTCAFLQEAIEESLEVIFDAAQMLALQNAGTKLVVTGCMPARFGDDLSAELEEADSFVACSEEENIVEVLDGLFDIEREEAEYRFIANAPRTDSTLSAYVKISDGCDRFCSFCAIPYIRGRYHSFPYKQIHAEVETLVEQGTREIVLIAQDTGMWGSDLGKGEDLADLMDRLAASFPITWFRVMYLEPEHITDKLIDVMKAHNNICNYLDIPFQHCNEEIIRSMNRTGSGEEFSALIGHLRESLPEITLRTTLIVGYPGETEEQFEELCDFVSEVDLDYVGVFAYSAEEGTKAAALPNQIDEETKLERLRQIRALADTVSSSQLSRFIGKTVDVLVLGSEEDGQLVGRSQYQAPEVDGVTYIDRGEIGTIVPVRIEDTLFYEMEGSCEQ